MLTSNDPSKKKTSVYQTAVQPGMASPNSNLTSPSTPGTVNVAGTQTRIPAQSSGKSGGFNRGPATPISTTPGLQPQPAPQQPPPGYIKKGNHYVSPDNKMIWAIGPDGQTYHSENSFDAPTGGQAATGDHGTLIRQEMNMPENKRSAAGHDVWAEAWKSGKTKLGQDEYLNSIGWFAANPVSNFAGGGQRMGQPMTLRDAYSTLSSAGYGSF